MPTALHDEAVAQHLLRYCPICDGYEVTDADVGVIGTGERGTREALFLRSFTKRVTLIAPDAQHAMSANDRVALTDAGIACVDGPITGYAIEGDRMAIHTQAGPIAFRHPVSSTRLDRSQRLGRRGRR